MRAMTRNMNGHHTNNHDNEQQGDEQRRETEQVATIELSRNVPEPCFASDDDDEYNFRDCKDDDIMKDNDVFDDQLATQYKPKKQTSWKDYDVLDRNNVPPREDIESWIDRALPPFQWGSMVLEPHPMARKKMSQMLTIRPREIINIWSGGMFGCFDDGAICILTCFCPCIQFGLNMAYNQHDHYKFFGWTCTNKAFFSSCIIQAMIWFLAPCFLVIPFFILHYYVCEGERGFPWDGAGPFECKYWWLTGGFSVARIPILVFAMWYGGYFRKLMRYKYGLPNDPFGEYVNYIFLSFCAICQEARTIKHLERRRRLNAVLQEIQEEQQNVQTSRSSSNDCMIPPGGGDVIVMDDYGGDIVVGVPIKAGNDVGQSIEEEGDDANDDDGIPLAVVVV